MASWSMKEFTYALKLRHEHKTYREIADILGTGRTAQQVCSRLCRRTMKVERERRPERVVVPLSAAQDQLLRGLLAPRDLTAWFMGDPLPGYSALDRRH